MEVNFKGELLHEKRISKNLTQGQLAELCETEDRYIRALESGAKKMPSAVLVFRMSKALDMTMEEFMEVTKSSPG